MSVDKKSVTKVVRKSGNIMLPKLTLKTRVHIKLYFSGITRLLSRSLLIVVLSMSYLSFGFAESNDGKNDERQIKIAGIQIVSNTG